MLPALWRLRGLAVSSGKGQPSMATVTIVPSFSSSFYFSSYSDSVFYTVPMTTTYVAYTFFFVFIASLSSVWSTS
jgi:hypothetical protein